MSVEGRRMARASRREQRATAERSEPRLGEIGRRGDQLIPRLGEPEAKPEIAHGK